MKQKIKNIMGIIKQNFKKYFSTNILFMSFVVFSLFIAISIRGFTIANIFEIKPIVIDLSLILIIGSFAYLIKPKNQFKYFLIWISLFAFIGIANSIYYEFFKSFITINLIDTLGIAGQVDDAILDKLTIWNFIYLIGPIGLVIVHSRLKKHKYYFEVEKIEKGKKMFIRTLVVGLIVVGLSIITLSSMEISRFVKQWNREYIVQRFGIYTYTFNDIVQSVRPKINTLFGYDEAAREFREFYQKQEQPKENKYTNMFEGKNVVFVHMESIQSFLVDLKINEREVTPNINQLTKEGIYFSKFYPQISVGTSSDTEFSLTTGLMPSSSGTVFVSYSNRTFESLPKYFNDLGYYTFSMHGNNADFWNRKVMHANLGYQKFYAKDSFNVDEVVGLGISDKSFFKQAMPILNEINTTKTNFMSTIITLSNHSPFGDLEKYGEFDLTLGYTTTNEVGEQVEAKADYLEGTDMGNYLKSARYADEALGEFISYIKESTIAENTIFVFYGDHEARLSKKQFNLLYNYNPETQSIKDEMDPTYISLENYNYELLKNTPLIIWNPSKKYKKEVTEVMGMYDILPTIGNMFGFYPKYALGHDIFSDNEKIVIFPNGNILTNKVYYNNLKDEYVLLTNEAIDTDYIDRIKKYAEERIDVSNAIIVHDLIKNEGEKNEKEKTK